MTTSKDLKIEGMARAADVRIPSLNHARDIARELCLGKKAVGHDPVTDADEVNRILELRGYANLGPAAGSIFQIREFEFTGWRIQSTRKSNHARELKIWRLR